MASSAPSFRTDDHGPAPRRGGSGGGLLTPAFLDELRHRITLSTLVGRTTKLQKAGREYKACCPFHQEKSPSFYVNDEKGFYHCFGCGAHGDAIRWMTEQRGLPFIDAVKELAQSAGMELPAPDPAARARAEKAGGMVGLNDQAAAFYRRQLDGIEGAAARAYLDKRGLGAHARTTFGLGYAPDGRNRLKPAIEGAKEAELVEAGLLIKPEGDGAAYDRFRGRLMIPIRDPRGRIIAFGGRIIGEGEPKYLNSPDTPLFDKGRTLFNLDRAGPIARRSGRILVAEGYLDVIALDQAGIGEAVAPLGTALTEAQMARLWSLVDAPILCFDGDNAGRKAGVRAARRALPVLRPGKTLRFALLPPGQDPDDIVRAGGPDAFEAAIAGPVPLDRLLYAAEREEAGDMARPEARAGLRQRLNDLAQSCADKLVAEEYRRAFNALFFEEFGWKKDERRAIASAIVRTAATASRAPGDLAAAYVRSLLYGLTRMPALIAGHIEGLAEVPIADPDLARWRAVLVEAALRDPTLDSDGIGAILDAALLPEALRQDIVHDLRFPFSRGDADPARAERQIAGLLEVLLGERELDEEFAMLDAEVVAAAVAEDGDDRYGRAESARAAARERRSSLLEAAMELGEPHG